MKIRLFTYIFLGLTFSSVLFAQDEEKKDYVALMNEGKYKEASDILIEKINTINDTRVVDKRIPTDFISTKKLEEGVDLNRMFRERKTKGFFIENNNELFTLHKNAGKCFYHLAEYDRALNHYFQALRFKNVEFQKDDDIYYEISQVYKKQKRFVPYRKFLELAYTLNQDKYEYSLELGNDLYRTKDKKKAIYHLNRYVESAGTNLKDPAIYLKIGNLNEDIGKYIETVKNYKKYLEIKPDDGYIHFALGYLAYKRVGDYNLAMNSFDKSLKYLPPEDIFRRSKANEYKGDIYMKELDFESARDVYNKTVNYQKQILDDIKKKKDEILKIRDDIQKLKSSMLKKRDYDEFNQYEFQAEEKGKLEFVNKKKQYEYKKLNAGKIRWNLAESFERTGAYEEAIKYYREAISFNYQSNKAREKIVKLKLKIKRGY